MGVYVHIPFCRTKCSYCDFYSVVVGDRKKFLAVANNYLSSLRQEALFYRLQLKESCLASLFIGGGTPTLLPAEDLAGLILFLRRGLPFQAEPEVTIEANPLTLTAEDILILKEAGVNRLSLGAQAFQDHLLVKIGRTHSGEAVTNSVSLIRAAGLQNINLDLMFGLPEQTLSEWRETLQKAVDLRPTHLSCYGLILEEGTPLHKQFQSGLVKLPTDDAQAEMYAWARQFLKKVGYEHYELSNFCLPGYRSQHNLLYWRNQSFLGLGAGATGYWAGIRYTNADLEKYTQSWAQGEPALARRERVPLAREMDETMMVGMRLLEGVAAEEFERRYGLTFWEVYPQEIERLLERGLVEHKQGFLRVSERGLFLENMVSGAFLR